MPAFLFLMAAATLAADTTPPTWPDQAWLEVGEDEALYDHPATTEAELAERWRQAQLHLYWPAAQDDTGVTGYRVLRGEQVMATVDGETRTWGVLTERSGPPWSVVPLDAAGLEGPPLVGILAVQPVRATAAGLESGLQLLLVGTLGGSVRGEDFDDVMSDEALAGLDAIFSSATGVTAASITESSITAPPTNAGPNVAIRVGRKGERIAVLERSFHWQAAYPIVWMLEVDGRDLKLQLAPEQQDGTPAWSLELHTWPEDDHSQLSRQVVLDPLSDQSLGSCALETDYRHTGGLWVEWGIDPRGGDPHEACERQRTETDDG